MTYAIVSDRTGKVVAEAMTLDEAYRFVDWDETLTVVNADELETYLRLWA